MAGKVGKSGGARRGAGRPPSAVLEYRREMQARATAVVTSEDVDAILQTAVAQARQGDDRARQWLTPLIFGKVADELKLSSDETAPLRIVIDG